MKRQSLLLLVVSLLGLVLMGALLLPVPLRSASLSPRQQVQAAWERALNQDAYRYTAVAVQTTHPTLRLENAGLGSQQTRFYMEGEVSRPQELVRLKLWRGAGRVGEDDNALEVKLEAGRAYGRAAGATDWQDLAAQGGSAFTDVFAPGNDPLLYLSAARDIRDLGAGAVTAGVQSQAYTRFAFTVDGLSFAETLRDQVQARLEREGRWPVGLTLDTARQYVDMEGEGELWVDGAGLPLRQVIHLRFPATPGALEWVEVEMTSDFARWDAAAATAGAAPMGGLSSSVFPFRRALVNWRALFWMACAGLAGLSLLLLLLLNRRSRLAYAALVSAVTCSMLVTPLLQSQQVYALTQEQRAQTVAQEIAQSERETQREATAFLQRPTFAPHLDPLTQAQWQRAVENGASFDARALPDLHTLAPVETAGLSAAASSVDTDGDGLSDDTEMLLGTDPQLADTDGDLLTDAQEARGFADANGQTWYTDPLSIDTNRDGRPDGLECTALWQGAAACNDLDGDGTPDVWDYDDDNDGVPDARDLSPTVAMGGERNAEGTIAPLPDGILNFQLDQYEAGKPLLVDFQLRPYNPQQLWYAFNVLDWPTDDRAGQIQRVLTTTLGAIL